MRWSLPAVLLLVFPLPVAAQGLAVRVTPDGLGELATIARSRLPAEHEVAAMHRDLYDCPGSRIISADIPDTTVHIGWHDLDVTTADGRLFVGTRLDIDVETPVTLHNPYACFGRAVCDVTAAIRDLGVIVELAAGTAPDGGIAFDGAEVRIELVPENVEVRSSGCAIGEVAEWMIEAVEKWLLERLIPRLETLASDRVAGALTEVLESTVGLTVERRGLAIEAWLDALELSAAHGVTVGGDAAVTWTGAPMRTGRAPSLDPATGAGLPAEMLGQLQLAVTDRVVTDALFEAWRGGLLTQLLAERGTSFALGGEGAVQQLGLPAGTEVEVTADLDAPLVATFGRRGRDVADLTLTDLHVAVAIRSPGHDVSVLDVRITGSVGAGVTVNAALGALVLELHDLEIAELDLRGERSELAIDTARLRSFVARTVIPGLSERLSGLPVAPALHAVAGTFLHVVSLESRGGWQRVGVDLHVPDTTDARQPQTFLDDPPEIIAAGTASLLVSGHDDTTPESLLRYRAWLDGEPLGSGDPTSIRAVRFDATDGMHVLEVAAVDLNGNEDSSPVRHEVVVDGIPPALHVVRSPAAIVTGETVRAAWTARDAGGGPVETSWQLHVIDEDGATRLVQEAPFDAARQELALATSGLQTGELYELVIVARDVAGNVTSESFGFARHPSTGGCAAVGAVPPASLPALLFGCAIVCAMARRLRPSARRCQR